MRLMLCILACVCFCVNWCICQGLHASTRKLQVLVCLHSGISLQPQSGAFFQCLSVEPFEFCFKKFKNIFNFLPRLILKEVNVHF